MLRDDVIASQLISMRICLILVLPDILLPWKRHVRKGRTLKLLALRALRSRHLRNLWHTVSTCRHPHARSVQTVMVLGTTSGGPYVSWSLHHFLVSVFIFIFDTYLHYISFFLLRSSLFFSDAAAVKIFGHFVDPRSQKIIFPLWCIPPPLSFFRRTCLVLYRIL